MSTVMRLWRFIWFGPLVAAWAVFAVLGVITTLDLNYARMLYAVAFGNVIVAELEDEDSDEADGV